MARNSRKLAIHIAALTVLLALSSITDAKIQRSRKAIAAFKQTSNCPSNGTRHGPCPGWQIDHIIPLKCGGADAPVNMQWLAINEHKAKTKRESRLCRIRISYHVKDKTVDA